MRLTMVFPILFLMLGRTVLGAVFLGSDYLGMLDNAQTVEAQLEIRAMGVSAIRTAMITYSEIEGPRCWYAALGMHGDELLGVMRRVYREDSNMADMPAPLLWSVTAVKLCQDHPDAPAGGSGNQ